MVCEEVSSCSYPVTFKSFFSIFNKRIHGVFLWRNTRWPFVSWTKMCENQVLGIDLLGKLTSHIGCWMLCDGSLCFHTLSKSSLMWNQISMLGSWWKRAWVAGVAKNNHLLAQKPEWMDGEQTVVSSLRELDTLERQAQTSMWLATQFKAWNRRSSLTENEAQTYQSLSSKCPSSTFRPGVTPGGSSSLSRQACCCRSTSSGT